MKTTYLFLSFPASYSLKDVSNRRIDSRSPIQQYCTEPRPRRAISDRKVLASKQRMRPLTVVCAYCTLLEAAILLINIDLLSLEGMKITEKRP